MKKIEVFENFLKMYCSPISEMLGKMKITYTKNSAKFSVATRKITILKKASQAFLDADLQGIFTENWAQFGMNYLAL